MDSFKNLIFGIKSNDESNSKNNKLDEIKVNTEDLKYKEKDDIELILNEILPCIKNSANKINKSLDRQNNLIDDTDNLILNSTINLRKSNKLINDKF